MGATFVPGDAPSSSSCQPCAGDYLTRDASAAVLMRTECRSCHGALLANGCFSPPQQSFQPLAVDFLFSIHGSPPGKLGGPTKPIQLYRLWRTDQALDSVAKIRLRCILSSPSMKMLFRRVSKLSRVRKSSRGQSSRRRRVTRFEALESRQLLAADITGAVYNDLNGDGVHNNGEVGLANWTVFLDLDSNGNLDAGEPSTFTSADGKYDFRGLAAGDYRVAEVVRSGWHATNPITGYLDVTLVDGQDKTVNFLNQGSGGTGVITGNVWRDINNNGVQDPEDTGLAGWTLFLDLDGLGTLDPDEPFVLTDGNGDYTFTGILGGAGTSPLDYEVTEVVPAGWEPRDINITAAVYEGQTTPAIDFSNWPDPEKTTSVSGLVFDDANGNGVQDGGESGLSGWTVYADLNLNSMLDAGEPFGTTTGTGDYALAGLEAGNIRIAEVQHIDYKPTSPAAGYRNVLVNAGVPVSNVNFGNQLRSDAAIGGVIFVDRDQDGVRDPGEEGLPGITVYLDVDHSGSLTPGDPAVVTSVDHFYTPDVDEAGSYRFEKLAGGTYVVRQIVPPELDSPGSEVEHTIVVGPSDDISDLELGDEYRPSEIHGFQYEDVNGNHVRDAGEPGLEGVTIFLDLNRNNVLDVGEPTTLTLADGSYEFVGLEAGAYVVREVVPDGFVQTFPQTLDGILWPAGVSNPAVGDVTPNLIELSLTEGESRTQTVSLTLPTTGALTNMVDVFLLFDDTGSFTFNSPIVRAAFPEIIAQLETRLPGINLGFGVGRLEEYGNFAAEYSNGRPFILNQPVIASSSGGYSDAEVLASIQAALDHVAPGYGGDTPETVIEALYQMVTGTGFDGDNNGSLLDSGPAGLLSTQVDPGGSGDVPPFASFTPDPANGVLPASGSIGGAGFRSGALPIIITATDTGFAYQPKGETEISGIDGLKVPVLDVTYDGRGTTPFDSGAGIQETVTGLNALGALVIGLGTNPEATIDPRIGLESLAKLTGAINRATTPIASGITGDPIDQGDPLYFMIGSGGDPLVKNIADGIVAAIEGAVTAVQVNVTLRASDPRVHLGFTPGVINGLGAGDTATFDVTFTGDGRPHRFDLQFIREGTDVVLGSIPVVLGTPISGDGYEFEDCEDGEHSQGIDFGNQRADGVALNVAPSFTLGANQSVAEDAGAQTVTAWATNISPGPANESGQAVNFIVSIDDPALFASPPAISPTGTLTYTPAADAFGVALVTVQLHDNGGTVGGGVDTSVPQTFTITVNAVNDVPVGVPTITGTAQKGQLLTADTSGIRDADGLGPFNHQWLRNGVAVVGETASTYLLGDADAGAQIRVQVRYTDAQGTSEGPLTSAATTVDSPAGITVTPTSLATKEGGSAQTFQISLDRMPTDEVRIPIRSSDLTEGSVDVTEVVFLPGETGPITVTVTPVDDLLAGSLDGNVVYAVITEAAISLDPDYSGLDAADVTVTNQDNDVAVQERVYADQNYTGGSMTVSRIDGGIVATYAAFVEDAAEQVLVESEVPVTGGRKPKLGSALEYQWSFPGLSGASTFHVDAYHSTGADDNFRFEYSTNNGSSWNVLGTIDQTAAYQDLTVNGLSLSGDVLVRVVDTDRSAASGKSTPILDSVIIDHMYFEKLQEDLRPAVTVTALDEVANENPLDLGTFRLERSEVSSTPLLVSFLISGTADNGTDYVRLAETVTIPANETFVDLVVNPLDDFQGEGPETVVLTLSEQSPYRLGSSRSATVTIVDDDLQQFVAIAEVSGAGTVSGDFTLTHNAGDSQGITELRTGGKPSSRYSYLEHTWTFDVTGANSFYLNASTDATADGFAFAYSTDGGATYPSALTTLGPGGTISQSFKISNLSGIIHVRVIDTNRDPGETSLETVFIEQMHFSTLAVTRRRPCPRSQKGQTVKRQR